MKKTRRVLAVLLAALALGAAAEIQVINGVRYECADGLCRRVEEPASASPTADSEDAADSAAAADATLPPRVAQGYMEAESLLAFLRGERPAALPASALALVLTLLLAGAAMNLTPCVLPMVSVNLIVIGKSPRRGLLYGLGIALAYGLLGVLAAVGGLAFGTIQSSPVFQALVALVFAALGLSLCGAFSLDLTRFRGRPGASPAGRDGALFPFFMGALSAVLAGACVAPILISVLVLTADLHARGNPLACGIPFVLGLGMALPWPFLGAGLKVLPKPGGWMKWVNRVFAVLVFGLALWHGRQAVRGFCGAGADPSAAAGLASHAATPATFPGLFASLGAQGKPIFVDCWATWCKNCAAMERGPLRDSRVVEALKGYSVIRLQAEDLAELKRLPGFGGIQGLPAFLVFEQTSDGGRP